MILLMCFQLVYYKFKSRDFLMAVVGTDELLKIIHKTKIQIKKV